MSTKILSPCGNAPHDYGYVLAERAGKGKPWREIARFASSGECCLATAEDHAERQMGWKEDSIWHSINLKMFSSGPTRDEWAAMQAKQHLKSLKIKISHR